MRHTAAMAGTLARGPIEVTVEIPSGSRNKYEYDHRRHRFVLDRVLFSSVHYPCDYGFIEGTMAEDGDPLDVLVVIAEPTFPGCVVRARPVGVLDMADDKGHDYKILAVAHDDPRWNETSELGDLSPHRLLEIEDVQPPAAAHGAGDRERVVAAARSHLQHALTDDRPESVEQSPRGDVRVRDVDRPAVAVGTRRGVRAPPQRAADQGGAGEKPQPPDAHSRTRPWSRR